ncbi:hypothetical protein PLICRDRAFT_34337 [Plicaturopsis crispa FD-325 SS-3]|nr:hypothetical protein PLICRDRAFT_34337 [Plicaturopsis crispa FD-325 SS-3]
MPKPTLEFFPTDSSSVPTTPLSPESPITERILSFDPDTGDKTAIQVCPPNYAWGPPLPERVTHTYWEEVYIIRGGLTDLGLGKTWKAGMYCCRPPGMPHGPYTTGDEECEQLVINRHEPMPKK